MNAIDDQDAVFTHCGGFSFFFFAFLPTKSDYVTYFLKAADRFTLTEQIPGTLTYLLSCRP